MDELLRQGEMYGIQVVHAARLERAKVIEVDRATT